MEKLKQIVSSIELLLEDNTIPRNIKKALLDAKERLKGGDELNIKVSSAVYSLNSISEDINMPSHARMQIWTIMSDLESLKG